MIKITEFILFKKDNSPHWYGKAKYFGVESRDCIIKCMKKKQVVLVKNDNGKFEQVGLFYPEKGTIRGAKEYEVVGRIWTPDYTFHVVKDGDRFLAL
jgi:hypothetical protein